MYRLGVVRQTAGSFANTFPWTAHDYQYSHLVRSVSFHVCDPPFHCQCPVVIDFVFVWCIFFPLPRIEAGFDSWFNQLDFFFCSKLSDGVEAEDGLWLLWMAYGCSGWPMVALDGLWLLWMAYGCF